MRQRIILLLSRMERFWWALKYENLKIKEYETLPQLTKIPPKMSVSELIGALKGRTAIRIFKQNPGFKTKLYWGNHFWAPGYCVDTIGLNEEMIRKYVRYQEKKERQAEELGLKF